jgi:hypothetical protein
MTAFDVNRLLEQATTETGLSDFGDDSFREGLGIYCGSLETEAQLNELGGFALQANVVGDLTNRLRLVDWAARHPEVLDEQIEAPVFVIGLFRAGTTLLSQLLDQDPGNRSLLGWEAHDCTPPPTPANHRAGERVDAARAQLGMLDEINPDLKAIHHEEPDGPTECIALLCQDFKALLWESVANVPCYGEWLMKTDHESAYRHHRLALQVLQSGGVRGRWTLKSPHHALALDALTAVYPDARLIYLHRDPVEVAMSAFSLIRCLSGTFSGADHTRYIVERWTEVLVQSVERVEAFRDRRPDVPLLDVRYTDLIGAPLPAVQGIYQFLGQQLDPVAAGRMQSFLDANPQGRFGSHRYQPSDFGVQAGELRERFAGYLDRYAVTAAAATSRSTAR